MLEAAARETALLQDDYWIGILAARVGVAPVHSRFRMRGDLDPPAALPRGDDPAGAGAGLGPVVARVRVPSGLGRVLASLDALPSGPGGPGGRQPRCDAIRSFLEADDVVWEAEPVGSATGGAPEREGGLDRAVTRREGESAWDVAGAFFARLPGLHPRCVYSLRRDGLVAALARAAEIEALVSSLRADAGADGDPVARVLAWTREREREGRGGGLPWATTRPGETAREAVEAFVAGLAAGARADVGGAPRPAAERVEVELGDGTRAWLERREGQTPWEAATAFASGLGDGDGPPASAPSPWSLAARLRTRGERVDVTRVWLPLPDGTTAEAQVRGSESPWDAAGRWLEETRGARSPGFRGFRALARVRPSRPRETVDF